jgi:hypothetical protein
MDETFLRKKNKGKPNSCKPFGGFVDCSGRKTEPFYQVFGREPVGGLFRLMIGKNDVSTVKYS